MFVGHLGVGLALKKTSPEINLGVLFFASLLLDVLLGLFILTDLEQVMVPGSYARLHYLHFSFPYSHSLLAAAAWSIIAFGVAFAVRSRNPSGKLKVSLVIGSAVLIHWICDWLEHPPQLPLAGNNSIMLGLGLWNDLPIALTIEVLLVAAGTMIYLKTAGKIGRTGRWGIAVFMIFLTVVAVTGQATVTQAPEQNAVAVSMIVQALVVCALASWLDCNRQAAG